MPSPVHPLHFVFADTLHCIIRSALSVITVNLLNTRPFPKNAAPRFFKTSAYIGSYAALTSRREHSGIHQGSSDFQFWLTFRQCHQLCNCIFKETGNAYLSHQRFRSLLYPLKYSRLYVPRLLHQHCKKRSESTHTVILSVCKHHAAIQTTITCFSCQNNLQFCRKIFLFHLIILFQASFITFAFASSFFSFSSRLSSIFRRTTSDQQVQLSSTAVDAFFPSALLQDGSAGVCNNEKPDHLPFLQCWRCVPSFLRFTPCSASGDCCNPLIYFLIPP